MRSVMITLLVVFFGACASNPAVRTPVSLEMAAAEYFAASKAGDSAGAERLLATEHVFIGPTGSIQDKVQRVAWLRENAGWLTSVTTRDVLVKDFGTAGLVTGIWVIPDEGRIIEERFSHVWLLRDGGWQMISHQVTEIPAP